MHSVEKSILEKSYFSQGVKNKFFLKSLIVVEWEDRLWPMAYGKLEFNVQ
jgi:hypothetical protein